MSTLMKRTFSTIILLSLLAGSVFLPYQYRAWFFTVLCSLLGFGAAWECCDMLNGPKKFGGLKWFVSLSLVAVVLFPLVQKRYMPFWPGISFDVVVFAFMAWMVVLASNKNPDALRAVLNTTAVFFLFSTALKLISGIYYTLNVAGSIPATFLLFILGTKSGDIGAYLTGSLCNAISHGKNHKLVPAISPAKSWEGLFGGLIFSIGISVGIYAIFSGGRNGVEWWDGFGYWRMAVIGVLMFFGGMLGDLAESSLKRTCQVKDSGHFLPGIGGLFDLVDSLIVNSFVFYLILFFFNAR